MSVERRAKREFSRRVFCESHAGVFEVDARQSIRQLRMREAEGYLELGMPAHALATLDRLGNVSVDAHALYLKGEALRELERYDEAALVLEEAAEVTPDDIHVWLALGWCYKRTRRLHLAIESLEEALEFEPGDALIHYNLSCYWSLAGNKDMSLSYLSEALRIDANYRDMVDAETDFDALRNDPDFLEIISVMV